ncbi:uncharacterized protein LOC128126441 isoform X2 [Lactuca sativa]|uniref:uncharacterized protein LOC128126441 isoform X2 n=1 Tax=Lactuca sativa TaxID=4236 RepID=UPI0022AFAA71|nr:uncharacterized protein LOC128126441 isoform X2 [Lactuca sativa]
MGTMVSKNYNRIRIIYCTDFDFAFNIWKWTNKEVSSTVTYSITGWKVVPGSCLVFFPGYVVDKIVLAGPPLVKVLLGTDSHTCTAGAFGQFATGIGNTDAGFVLGTGKLLLKVPPTLRFVLDREMQDYLLANNLILQIIGEISISKV